MPMRILSKTIKDFGGVIDTLESTSIPRGYASRSLNWLCKVDRILLRGGYRILGNNTTGSGKITGFYVARMGDGTEIPFRKSGQKLEYYSLSTDTWIEIGTNVFGSDAEDEEVSFAEYHSLAGDQLFVNSPNGVYLKIMLANPASYTDVYDATKNYKGYIKIKQGRTFLFQSKTNKQMPYLSYIDDQEVTNQYTLISDENVGTGDGATKTFTDTLAFKAAGAKRTCFGIEVTDGTETFTDNKDGTLTGDAGGTGTINYTSGAISITFNAAVTNLQAITADYYWEDVTAKGVCDFTFSATRLAGEGDFFLQGDGGGILQNIESFGDTEICLHEKKTWFIVLTDDDTAATNNIYRDKVGIPNWKATAPTANGIYYIDDTDKSDPQIKFLTIPYYGTEVESLPISKGIKYKNALVGVDLSGYRFDKAMGWEWGDYIIFACRTEDSTQNDRLILYNKKQKTIDWCNYYANMLSNYGGELLVGDSVSGNVMEIFSGYEDEGASIENYWESGDDDLDFEGEKRVKKIRVTGRMGVDQAIAVYASLDKGDYALIDTITVDEADYTTTGIIGRAEIGEVAIGGGSAGDEYIEFTTELDFNSGKFNNIRIKFVAAPDNEIGYAEVSSFEFYDIRLKSRRANT